MAKLRIDQLDQERQTLEWAGPRIVKIGGWVGVASLAASAVLGGLRGDGGKGLAYAYLVALCYFLTLSLGGLCFVMLQHLTHAGWGVVVRRVAEIVAAAMPVVALLAVPVVVAIPRLYGWSAGGHGEGIADKSGYLNVPFFIARLVVYFAVWSVLAWYLLSRSSRQDASGDPAVTLRLVRVSGLGVVVYAITVTLASFDLIMSLDAAWFSTMFGVYVFAGSFVSFLALLGVLLMGLQRSGRLVGIVTREHYHDVGKLLFAFVFFWGYIAFSQYMLIWYANLPEETGWLVRRLSGWWGVWALALLFGHFVLPFVGLIGRWAKRRRGMLLFWSVWVLIVHWMDLYWLIMPEWSPSGPPVGVLDATCWLGVGGLYVAGLAMVAGQRSLVPTGDPRLGESLAFENA